MELMMGLGLSIAGVFFLQSAAHEIGVRTLTDQPMRLVDRLNLRRTEYAERVSRIREDVRARYMASKLADQERKRETVNINPIQAAPDSALTPNVNGHFSEMASDIGKTST